MVIQAGSHLLTHIIPSQASRVTPPFDGGLFVNGGFEDGLNGWQEATSWTVVDEAAQNPGTIVNEVLFQNFTLELNATYSIQARQLEGDAAVHFLINDADSGIDVKDGTHTFLGDGQARSFGILVSTAGTTTLTVDSLKLAKVADVGVVTYNGEIVTYNGEEVTYGVL